MKFYKQQGVVIVIVLLMILLISTASMIAIKNSQVSTEVTTAFHVNQLLTISSDNALAQFENAINDPVQYSLLTSINGPIGYLSQDEGSYKDAEFVICYQPTQRPHLYSGEADHKIIAANLNWTNSQGHCQISADGHNGYTSHRKTIATQLSFVRPQLMDLNGKPSVKEHANKLDLKENEILDGTDLNSYNELKLINPMQSLIETDTMISHVPQDEQKQPVHFRLYITSIIPFKNDASLKDIESCMAKPISPAINFKNSAEGLLGCLDRTRTPYDVQIHDFWYALDRD